MNTLYVIYGLRLKSDKKIRYVGLTTKGKSVRFNNHFQDLKKFAGNNNPSRPVCHWLRKHGKDLVESVILESCPDNDIDYLNYAEKYWITSLREMGFNLLNLSNGGKGSNHITLTEEHKQNISNSVKIHFEKNKQKDVYEYWLEKYGAEEANRLREEKRKKASASISGKNNPMYGRTGESAPAFGRTGVKHPMYGKVHSDITKEKMSKKLLGKPKPIGMGLRLSFTRHTKNHTIKNINCMWCNGALLENEIKLKEKEFNGNETMG
jgi:hypothetical protein